MIGAVARVALRRRAAGSVAVDREAERVEAAGGHAVKARHADRRVRRKAAERDGVAVSRGCGRALRERHVAPTLAHGLAPLGKDAHKLTGLARSSSAQHALRSLIEHGRAEQLPGGHYTLIDPLFTIWLAQRHQRQPNR
jgi:hypothetical protein